mmetsp:Transcript_19053/g.27923  ORF Transcript_19053/g.27923 Transcript_19053/m.27923 type:complete len:1047 (+) Transcript_19053:87-3227(+)
MTYHDDSIVNESEIVSTLTFSTVHSLPNYGSFLFCNDTLPLASSSMYSLQSSSTVSVVRRQLTSNVTNIITATNITDSDSASDDLFDWFEDNAFSPSAELTGVNTAKDISINGVLTSLALNIVTFVVLMTLYEILRRVLPGIYSIGRTDRRTEKNGNKRSNMKRKKSAYSELMDPIETAVFPLWVPDLVSIPWSKVLSVGGLDAYMFLRYIRMCIRITFTACIWSIFILFPVFTTGNMEKGGWYHFSMANVDQSSWRIWFPTVFMWLMTIFVLWMIRKEYHHYLAMRMEFLGTTKENIDVTGVEVESRYSIMLERIPRELKSNEALFGYFDRLFPGKVHSANVVMNLPTLEKLATRRRRVTRRLEKSIAHNEATGERATHVLGHQRCMFCGIESEPIGYCCDFLPSFCCGTKKNIWDAKMDRLPEKGEVVDNISYYSRELADMNEKVTRMQRERLALAARGSKVSTRHWMKRVVQAVSGSAAGVIGSHAQSGEQANYGATSTTSIAAAKQQKEQVASTPGQETNKSYQDTEERPLMLDGTLHQGKTYSHACVRSNNSNKEDLRKTDNLFRKFLTFIGFDFIMAWLRDFNNFMGDLIDSKLGTMSATGFVTFKDLTSVTCAASAPLTNTPQMLNANLAPEPRDIIWKNCHVDIKINNRREWVSNVFFGIGAILWSVPLAGIQALATAEYLAKIPGFAWIIESENTLLANFVNSNLPVLALLGIIMLLPIIFDNVAYYYEQRKTHSDIQHSIVTRYFYYQLANIYVTVTAGTVFNALHLIIDHPQQMLIILGTSLPKMVGYFISLLITKILAGLPLVMLRLGALSRVLLLRSCFREETLTQRELDEGLYRKEVISYGWEYPTQLLVIVICFTYACISPIILVFGTLYFMGALLVYKKQLLFVYTPLYESGGQLFPSVCDRTLVGLICGQITFIGYCLIRKGHHQPFFLAPLPFITLYFMYRFSTLWNYPSRRLSLERAVELDENNRIEWSRHFREDAYRQPVLTESVAEPSAFGTGSNPDRVPLVPDCGCDIVDEEHETERENLITFS